MRCPTLITNRFELTRTGGKEMGQGESVLLFLMYLLKKKKKSQQKCLAVSWIEHAHSPAEDGTKSRSPGACIPLLSAVTWNLLAKCVFFHAAGAYGDSCLLLLLLLARVADVCVASVLKVWNPLSKSVGNGFPFLFCLVQWWKKQRVAWKLGVT